MSDDTDYHRYTAAELQDDLKPIKGSAGDEIHSRPGGTVLEDDGVDEGQGGRKSQTTRLIEIAAKAKLFHDAEGNGYADIRVGGHRETWSVKSKGFRDWLRREYFARERRGVSGGSLQDAVATTEAQAVFDGPERSVHLRLAEHEGAIFIDLCDAQWRAIKVDANGWSMVSEPPVRFIRKKGMSPMPVPKRGGSIEPLWRFLNVRDKPGRTLIIGCLVAALRPRGPYVVLVLLGPEGTGKSTATRIYRAFVDPNTVPLRTVPRDERDLMIAARNGWVIALDNLSRLPNWLSDACCRIATGGGLSTRELYTDTDEILIDVQRPMILNSIADILIRQDLISRCVVINLKKIKEKDQKAEDVFWSEFNAELPGILGALLDRVSRALRNLNSVDAKLPRMADYAKWVMASEPPEERGQFIAAYSLNRREAIEAGLEGSPVATALRLFMDKRDKWDGTATQLLGLLPADAKAKALKSWPRSAISLGYQLAKVSNALQIFGINIEHVREPGSGERTIKIKKVCKKASQSSLLSQTPANQGNRCDSSGKAQSSQLSQPVTKKADQNNGCDSSDRCDNKMQAFSNEAALGPDHLKGAEVCQACAGGGCRQCDWYGLVDRTATVAP